MGFVPFWLDNDGFCSFSLDEDRCFFAYVLVVGVEMANDWRVPQAGCLLWRCRCLGVCGDAGGRGFHVLLLPPPHLVQDSWLKWS